AQSTVGVYVLQLYMPMYAVKQLHMPAAASFGVVVLNGGLQFLLSPVMGALSDRIGRIRIMLTTSILMGALICYYVLIAAVLSGLSLVVVAWRMRRVRHLEGVQPS
ncbi:MAG TPA: hypothetical protein VHV99_04680, partial [Paraburkholderia sp.]|nr:hypothetical protein [Paraburkholderia sp.]